MKNDKSKNIVQIFATRAWGGGEQYVYDLSKELMKNNYHVFFISRKSPDIDKKLKAIHSSPQILPMSNFFDIRSIIQLAYIIRKYNIELIHSHQFKDAFIALFAGIFSRKKIKVILTRHLVKKAKVNALYTFLYKRIHTIIFVSDLAKKEFLSSNPKISLNKIITITNSVYPALVLPEQTDLRTKYQIGDETLIFAYTGGFVKGKGVEILLDAVKNLKDLNFVLLIAGKGEKSYEQLIKTKVEGENNKILFTGFIDNIHSFVNQADIGILPSIWREAMPLSVIEFMQAGKPVITTSNGGQRECITNLVDGILIPPSDEQALAKAIRFLAENREKRLTIGKNAQKTFSEKLSYPVFYSKISSVYSS